MHNKINLLNLTAYGNLKQYLRLSLNILIIKMRYSDYLLFLASVGHVEFVSAKNAFSPIRHRKQQRNTVARDLMERQLVEVRSAQDFCTDLTPVSEFLSQRFLKIFNETGDPAPTLVPESGYVCSCIGGTGDDDLALKCILNYTWPLDETSDPGEIQEYFINTESANFTVSTYNGEAYYVPTFLQWCDRIDGVAPEESLEHCEMFEYCDHDQDGSTAYQLCSCSTNEGDACSSCVICDDAISVAINCTGIDENSPFHYETTCEDTYGGPLLSSFRQNMTDVLATPVLPQRSFESSKSDGNSANSAANSLILCISIFLLSIGTLALM